MKKVYIVLLFFLGISFSGKTIDFNASTISEDLKKNAKSVVRKDIRIFDITNYGKAILSVDYAVTILDESAYNRAIFKQSYDKFRKIKSIKAAIYDAQGKLIKRIKFEDITDMSIIQGAESFDDNRVKYFDPEYKFYPFTIEYSYEMQFDGLLGYPDWSPYMHYEESVELSSMHVITDNVFEFKYMEKNGVAKAVISEDGSKKIYKWEMRRLPAKDYEYFSPDDANMPIVYIAPNEFEYDGRHGFCYSWNELASWFSKLNADRNNLSPTAKAEIEAVVAGVNDPYQKIELLYKYMQDRTRYVSIQLGIGGLQPFDANTVERLGYGDCKALTNYMQSILEVVNIPSNYVLVNSGENASEVLVDFPSDQFNHVFLMVPLAQDTVWLECTSQQVPYNFLGSFTDDRDVLVIQENGGKLIRTPAYSPDKNSKQRNVTVTMDENGNANVDGITTYAGAQYSDVFGFLFADKKDVENALNRRIDISDFVINSFNYKNNKTNIEEELSLSVNNFAKKSRENLIMPLNLMNKTSWVPKKDDDRTVDVFIRRSYSENDKVTYKYPAGFHIGSLPEPVNISSKFGTYSVSIRESNGTIEYEREFVMYKGNYPYSEFNTLIDFMSEISKADRMKVLLVGGT